MKESPILGVIGGSGVYRMEGLEDVSELKIETPFGDPSAPILLGTLSSQRVAFLARHGNRHQISPSEINYRANIYALKLLGVKRIVSVSACGSLREQIAPGDMVIPDQLVDQTRGRIGTFFSEGLVAHIGVADPFCPELSRMLGGAVHQIGATVHEGGSFVTIEGPRFSTRAESIIFRSWGMTIIGMTTSPEAFLAREAEMCYAVMGHVTDYDVWHETEEAVTVEMVLRTLKSNASAAQNALRSLVVELASGTEGKCNCHNALADTVVTDVEQVSMEKKVRLHHLISKYIE